MRALKILFKGLLLLAGVFIAGGFMISPQWEVSRSLTMHASPEQIFQKVANFKEWDNWSPWSSKKYPDLKYTYEGPDLGKGAKQNWASDSMGKGWMQISQANPETGVDYDLHMTMKNSESILHGSITFSPDGATTLVTWTDKADSGNSFVKRWMSLLLKMMLGKDLETGLTNLKNVVEKDN